MATELNLNEKQLPVTQKLTVTTDFQILDLKGIKECDIMLIPDAANTGDIYLCSDKSTYTDQVKIPAALGIPDIDGTKKYPLYLKATAAGQLIYIIINKTPIRTVIIKK